MFNSLLGNNRIQFFKPSGLFVKKLGTRGDEPGQFKEPLGVVVNPITGDILVADAGNQRVQIFTGTGDLIRVFGSFSTLPRLDGGIAVDSRGSVVIVDSSSHRVQCFSSEGKLLKQFGTEGGDDGELYRPVGVTFDQESNIVVLDPENGRIQLFGV